MVVTGAVLTVGRDLRLSVSRVESVHALYAAEAGASMAIRELMLGVDEDGDGGIGSISDDGNDANDPALDAARLTVSISGAAGAYEVEVNGRSGQAHRSLMLSVEGAAGSGGGTAMMAYGLNSSASPQYRLLNGGSWGSAASARSVGSAAQWLVLRAAPDGRFALVTLDNDVDVEVQIWDGAAWGTVYQATSDAGDKSTRVFDLAFEQVSGHALLVYRKSGVNEVRYRTHDGTSWSAEGTLSLTGSAPADWIALVPRAGSDEILLNVAHDGSEQACAAAVWNGTGFLSVVTLLDNDGSSGGEFACAAWEGLSGDGLAVMRDDDDSPRSRSFSGGSWSGVVSVPSVGGSPKWFRLASRPGSDEALMASLDASMDINANAWNGSSWGTNVELETDAPTSGTRHFDLAWGAGGSTAIIAFGESNSNVLRYRVWNGSSWSAEASGPNGGNKPIWSVQLVTGLSSGEILAVWCMDNAQMRAAVWNGASFGAATVLGISSAPKEFEPFGLAVSAPSESSLALSEWAEQAP